MRLRRGAENGERVCGGDFACARRLRLGHGRLQLAQLVDFHFPIDLRLHVTDVTLGLAQQMTNRFGHLGQRTSRCRKLL